MLDESLPELTKAPVPVQTHILRLEERIAKGKALREIASRKAQTEWKPPADRADPVDLLVESSKGRVEELLPIRYGRMMVSPFTFYRGAAAIMAYDLAHTPSTGLTVVADGDCHLMNFGGFATAERQGDLRPQRLRRSLDRPLGVGCQTADCQLRGCRALEWVRSSRLPGSCLAGRTELPPAHGRICRDAGIAGLERCLRF